MNTESHVYFLTTYALKSKKSCCSSFLMFPLPTLNHQIEYTFPSLVTETVITRTLTSVSPYVGQLQHGHLPFHCHSQEILLTARKRRRKNKREEKYMIVR
jgi:hypothetical protein